MSSAAGVLPALSTGLTYTPYSSPSCQGIRTSELKPTENSFPGVKGAAMLLEETRVPHISPFQYLLSDILLTRNVSDVILPLVLNGISLAVPVMVAISPTL